MSNKNDKLGNFNYEGEEKKSRDDYRKDVADSIINTQYGKGHYNLDKKDK